jgi:pilus assembly protein TadC
MPTIKPRVQVTLEPSTHEVIERLANLQGKTRGGVISEMLDSIVPAITRTVTLLEAAAAAPESLKDNLRAAVEGAQADLADASGDSSKQLDILMKELKQEEQTKLDEEYIAAIKAVVAAKRKEK